MGKTIDVDFNLLDTNIDKMRALKKRLSKPKISAKMDLVKNGGDGDVHDDIHSFTSTTIDYYETVLLLVKNTVSYLENARTLLKNADNLASQNIKKEG